MKIPSAPQSSIHKAPIGWFPDCPAAFLSASFSAQLRVSSKCVFLSSPGIARLPVRGWAWISTWSVGIWSSVLLAAKPGLGWACDVVHLTAQKLRQEALSSGLFQNPQSHPRRHPEQESLVSCDNCWSPYPYSFSSRRWGLRCLHWRVSVCVKAINISRHTSWKILS